MEVAGYGLALVRSVARLGLVLCAGCLDDPLRSPTFADPLRKPSGVAADAGDRVLRPAPGPVLFIPDVAGGGESDAAVDSIAGECDDSPIRAGDGYVMHGCRFLHHCYKVRHNGVAVSGDLQLCGADDVCLYRVTHICERWVLINNGEQDILVNTRTGTASTHASSHGGNIEGLPGPLALPVYLGPH